MPQVYAALHDDASNYLIVKKRIQNRWWGNGLGNPATVNQAGQWALPGGAQNNGETIGAAAFREFFEETGFDLLGFGALAGNPIVNTHLYSVIEIEVSPAQLLNIQLQTNANVQPNAHDARSPAGAQVADWELQETRIVHAAQLPNYLGVHQALPGGVRHVVDQQPAHRQAIDWYANIANVLQHY